MSSTREYQVTLYAQVSVRTEDVVAQSHEDAYEKALSSVDGALNLLFRNGLDPASKIVWTEYADEVDGALIDVVGDTQYAQSVFLNKFGHQEFTEDKCHCSCPELTIAASNLSIVVRSLGDDWLVRKLQSALDEIRDVAAVIRSRDDENDRDQRESPSK